MTSNSILYLIFAGVHFIFFISLARQYLRHRWIYTLIAVLVLFGLIYDNSVIGLGNLIGESMILKSLNVGRYIYHVIFTPMLALFTYGVLRKAGFSWAQEKRTYWIFLSITVALIIVGASYDLVGMEMSLVFENSVTRYVNITAAGKLPISAIVINLMLILAGLMIWHKQRIFWLAIGSIIMFVVYAIAPGNLLISNIGEIAFCWGIVGTNYKLLEIRAEN